jgi:prevent-host-death family protein
MRSVNIGTLKNQLSAYLQMVREGEEVVVRDRNKPVARIVPFKPDAESEFTEEELHLARIGVLKLPENPRGIDWEAFWKLPRPTVSDEAAKEAMDWVKGER